MLPAGAQRPEQQETRQEERQGRQQRPGEGSGGQQHGAQVGGQGEHGAGYQLGQAVAGQELLLAQVVTQALLQQGSTT